MKNKRKIKTGITSLDEILDGLRGGDNVVWNVDSIQDFTIFVKPFIQSALVEEQNVVYINFAEGIRLTETREKIKTYKLEPKEGFESFTTQLHQIILREGMGTFYIFDCLTELLSAWATDFLIGNFFILTCPLLAKLKTLAYFSFIRGSLSLKTISAIRETTQLLINVYKYRGKIYVHPLKVEGRKSPTMFLPHLQLGENFIPIANSIEATDLLSRFFKKGPGRTERQLDYWDRLFLKAESLAHYPDNSREKSQVAETLNNILIGGEERMQTLSRKTFSLEELLEIKTRMIGSGFIGGKAVGMLLARNILLRDKSFDWNRNLEKHDSFFVGSNVYYAFIIHNKWWDLYMKHKSEEGYFEYGNKLSEKMLQGRFPEDVSEKFQQILEYYGQYPIIVRSSSLLEDSFSSAFAGKYASIFCVNQGSPETRLGQFEEAVRKIFSSALSEDALVYRKQRNLDKKEEKMALLIQRVSGAYHRHLYFPELAGVGVSFNTFVWSEHLDPKAGMLRLVVGLGTRAVERLEGDYARIIAMDAPLLKPTMGFSDTSQFSQKELDLLNVNENLFQTASIASIKKRFNIPVDQYGAEEMIQDTSPEKISKKKILLITFDKLLNNTKFIPLMRRMLKTLEEAYQYPVEIEFTVNFASDNSFKINLVQCRPLATKGLGGKVTLPINLNPEQIFFQSQGNFMGGSISQKIDNLIWIDPGKYSSLHNHGKKEIANIVGILNKRIKEPITTMLMGPGRWGTSTPAMGVPVSFSDINNVSVLVEIAFKSESLMPELSFGSHFFQDLVETRIYYIALFPENENCELNETWLSKLPNLLESLAPLYKKYAGAVKVVDLSQKNIWLISDIISQKLICFTKN